MNSLKWKMWPEVLVCMHSTLLAYAPEQISLPHCTNLSHCKSTYNPQMTAHTFSKWIRYTIYNIAAKYQHQQQIRISNGTYMPYVQITSMGEVCQYICPIWTLRLQLCDQECCTRMTTTPTPMPTTMMTTQPDYISLLGDWPKSARNSYGNYIPWCNPLKRIYNFTKLLNR